MELSNLDVGTSWTAQSNYTSWNVQIDLYHLYEAYLTNKRPNLCLVNSN